MTLTQAEKQNSIPKDHRCEASTTGGHIYDFIPHTDPSKIVAVCARCLNQTVLEIPTQAVRSPF